MLLLHELIKYHISWEWFLSKIQLDDGKNLRFYSINKEKDILPSDSKENDGNLSDQPPNSFQQQSDRRQSSLDIPVQRKIDISFANKRHAKLSSRMTRNQAKKLNEIDFVDLDQTDDPTSSAVHAMLDLKG